MLPERPSGRSAAARGRYRGDRSLAKAPGRLRPSGAMLRRHRSPAGIRHARPERLRPLEAAGTHPSECSIRNRRRLRGRPSSRRPEDLVWWDCAWPPRLPKSLVVLVKWYCEKPRQSYTLRFSIGGASIVVNRVSTRSVSAGGNDCGSHVSAQIRSARRDAALHRAVNAGLQEADLVLAVERPERGL